MSAGGGAAGAPVGLKPAQIRAVMAGLMVAVLLAALDVTVMATALPTVAGGFGGLDRYAWVVTAYLLTSTAVMPLYGSLSDMYGRRRVLQIAVAGFLLGSVLCGVAQDMTQLIGFRAVQGVGAGGLMVLAITIIADLVPPRDRARYQGMLGAVFGFASVAGPLLGGLLTDANWRWIFFMNLPLGVLALLVTDRVLRRVPQQTRPRTLDLPGGLLLVAGVCCLLLVASWGGTTHPWRSPVVVGLAAAGACLTVAFLAVERRAREPLLPLALFRRRTFAVATAAGFGFGMAMFGLVTYTPMYLQVAKGHSATAAGLLMVPMMGGVVLASLVGGRLISRVGRFKWFTVAGAAIMTVGTFGGVTLGTDSSLLYVSTLISAIGLGMGLLMQPLIVALQHGLARAELGAGTATGAFLRQMGGAFGVAVLGAVLSARFSTAAGPEVPSGLREPARILALPEPVRTVVQQGLVESLQAVFLVAGLFGVGCLILTLLLPDPRVGGPPTPASDSAGSVEPPVRNPPPRGRVGPADPAGRPAPARRTGRPRRR